MKFFTFAVVALIAHTGGIKIREDPPAETGEGGEGGSDGGPIAFTPRAANAAAEPDINGGFQPMTRFQIKSRMDGNSVLFMDNVVPKWDSASLPEVHTKMRQLKVRAAEGSADEFWVWDP